MFAILKVTSNTTYTNFGRKLQLTFDITNILLLHLDLNATKYLPALININKSFGKYKCYGNFKYCKIK